MNRDRLYVSIGTKPRRTEQVGGALDRLYGTLPLRDLAAILRIEHSARELRRDRTSPLDPLLMLRRGLRTPFMTNESED